MLIDFNKVSFSYENPEEVNTRDSSDAPILDERHMAAKDISFTISEGEFVAIIGRNGSGKSTIARLMNALLIPSEGTILVDGLDTTNDEKIWEIRQTVGMVFQNPDNQIIGATVEDDVAFGLENLGVPHDEMLKRVIEAMDKVGISDKRAAEPHLLSGGQKQRVSIAGILAMKPKCIILDEATAMLDPRGRKEVIQVISELNKQEKITIILITHHMDEVSEADRVILVSDGKIVDQGTPREIFAKGDELVKCGLEQPDVTDFEEKLSKRSKKYKEFKISKEKSKIIENSQEKNTIFENNQENSLTFDKTRAKNQISINEQEIFDNICEFLKNNIDNCNNINKKIEYLPKTKEKIEINNDDAIFVSELKYVYGKKTPFEQGALENVTMNVKKGEFLGIIGHTGSGKSTLVQHFNGLLKADAGEIYINGEKMESGNLKAMRRKVGLVFQYPEYQLFESSVYKDIAFGISKLGLSDQEVKDRVYEAAKLVGISEEIMDASVYELSGGQKRRVAIAGILVMKPEILVLDEPAAGLDPEGRNSMLSMLKDLQRANNTTIIIVSHSMEVVGNYCDRIVVMNEGVCEMEGTPCEVFGNGTRLLEIGLDVPVLTRVFTKISNELPELNISREIFNSDDAVTEIMRLTGENEEATL